MIRFFDSSYNKKELQLLHRVIGGAIKSIPCDPKSHDCTECDWHNVCADMDNFYHRINTLINTAESEERR